MHDTLYVFPIECIYTIYHIFPFKVLSAPAVLAVHSHRATFLLQWPQGHGREANQAYHPFLNVTKEPQSGYISDTGQVFLHPLPSYIDNPSKATKKNWRNSATQQSVISSVNDTMYTRDTAETVLDTQSESDNYEGYLCGDLSSWNQEKSSSSSEGEGELATPKLRESKGWECGWSQLAARSMLRPPP